MFSRCRAYGRKIARSLEVMSRYGCVEIVGEMTLDDNEELYPAEGLVITTDGEDEW